MAIVTMIIASVLIILFVKYGLVTGVNQLAGALGWTAKARGQATGFATSVPELVSLIAAGAAGVWDAGLWNIASSNIINMGLMLIAMLSYRQVPELFNRRFIDELGFAVLAVIVPLVLMQAAIDRHWALVPTLLAFFVVYRVVDRRVNPHESQEGATNASGSLPLSLIFLVAALVAIAIAGVFLGDSAEAVVNELGVHPAAAGWILGTLSSLPEMVTFFAVYGAAKRAGTLDQLADTQEALDNLASSNMSNIGIIYPVGLAVYLLTALI